MADTELTAMVAEIVGSYVSNNKVAPAEIADLIRTVYSSLSSADRPETPAEEPATKVSPAQIKKSITPDALISFIDGRPYKTLKRHLTTNGMTVEEYKAKFGLPRDYPTTAPNYSAHRSAMAKTMGLGNGGRGRSADLAKGVAAAAAGNKGVSGKAGAKKASAKKA